MKKERKTFTKISETAHPHQQWAGEKKPSMKRRCEVRDYCERGIYMVTLATEGRQPVLGVLKGDPAIKDGDLAPHVELSPLGERVRDCWLDIVRHSPTIEPMKLCVMPDHIHGILFVHERQERHLGHVINGFKIGCRKAARELGVITAAMPQQKPSSHPAHGMLWEPGYNDRILLRKGQLERMFAYLDDNPRRLLLKRQHPEYFTCLGTLTVANLPMQAMGNRFLLDYPVKLQVQCSRSLSPDEIEKRKDMFLQEGHNGAILVSPCISPGEKQITTAALAQSIPLIVFLLNGFPPFFKPAPRYLEACAEGRLLMLAPFPYQNEKLQNMRQRCLQLNAYAMEICKDE